MLSLAVATANTAHNINAFIHLVYNGDTVKEIPGLQSVWNIRLSFFLSDFVSVRVFVLFVLRETSFTTDGVITLQPSQCAISIHLK